MQDDGPLPGLHAAETKLLHIANSSDSSSAPPSSRSYISERSSEGDDCLTRSGSGGSSPTKTGFRLHARSNIGRTVCSPYASPQVGPSQSRNEGNQARLTDRNRKNFVYGPDGPFVAPISDDAPSDISSYESTIAENVHRGTHGVVSRGKWSDNSSHGSGEIYLNTGGEFKDEDRLTRLSFVDRLPDLDGQRHYRIELPIDILLEEDKVRTGLGTISLSRSRLAILNKDGLEPKIASDLLFDNGILKVKESPVSGYGVFAVRDLEPYKPILIERELFNANHFDLYQKLDNLTAEQTRAFYSLHGHKRNPYEDIRVAIWRTNRFSTSTGGSVFLVASRFNHACNHRSNVDYSYDREKKCMVFATKKKIPAGSELFIQYGSDPQHLFATWGFRCTCGACPGISEDACKAIEALPLDGWGS